MPNQFDEINLEFTTPSLEGWHNRFHLEMMRGLINDPNGLSVYRGEVYIFYQWNPFGCEHRQKHWGLVKTTDFIHYSRPEIILSPQDWFDKDGCYSGCATVEGDTLRIYYTGNVKDELGKRAAYQILADYNGEYVQKQGVVIMNQPEGYTAHFRDPFIYREADRWYMLLGAQRNDLTGCTLLYRSDDGVEWRLQGELATSMNDFGYMWECPNLLKVSEDIYALLFCPQGVEGKSKWLQNEHQSGYVLGELDFSQPMLSHGEFYLLDRGFDFYAPQIFTNDEQTILIGWAGMPDKESEYPTEQEGWRFSLTIPRLLSYRDDRLYQQPLPALQSLRGELLLQREARSILEEGFSIALPQRSGEINCMVDLRHGADVEFVFACADEKIYLRYNNSTQQVQLDRSSMCLGGQGSRNFPLPVGETLELKIFVDRSMIEIFYQDGREVSTITYFPLQKDAEMEFICAKELSVQYLMVYELGQIIFG